VQAVVRPVALVLGAQAGIARRARAARPSLSEEDLRIAASTLDVPDVQIRVWVLDVVRECLYFAARRPFEPPV
jgi:hypothetical protein